MSRRVSLKLYFFFLLVVVGQRWFGAQRTYLGIFSHLGMLVPCQDPAKYVVLHQQCWESVVPYWCSGGGAEYQTQALEHGKAWATEP